VISIFEMNINTIKKTDHCEFCDYHKKELQKGTYCGLTNEKPVFIKICNEISLNELLLKKIETINSKHYKLLNRKAQVIARLLFFPLIGVIILYGDYWSFKNYYYPNFLENLDYGSKAIAGGFGVATILFIVGLTFIGKGVGPLLNYLNNKKYTKREKEKLDTICKLNEIMYVIDYHKKRNLFDVDVHIRNIQLKKTAIIR